MRTIKYLIAAFVFLLIMGAIIGLFLPSKAQLTRSIEINRSPEAVFKVINSMKNFNSWSPWKSNDPNVVYSYSGAEQGAGAKMLWSHPSSNHQGYQEIIESKPYSLVRTQLSFGKTNKQTNKQALTTLQLSPTENGTLVDWIFELDFGKNLIKRYSASSIEQLIGGDLEKGLALLKQHIEQPIEAEVEVQTQTQNQAQTATHAETEVSNISVIEQPLIAVYAVNLDASLPENQIAEAMGVAYGQILNYFAANNLSMSGAPLTITKMLNQQEQQSQQQSYQLIAAIPVLQHALDLPENNIKALFLPAGKTIKMVHKGSYDDLPQSYERLNAYAFKNKFNKRADSWEEYISDPSNVHESELITHIYLPIE